MNTKSKEQFVEILIDNCKWFDEGKGMLHEDDFERVWNILTKKGFNTLARLQEPNATRSKQLFDMNVARTPLWRFAFGLIGEANEIAQDIRKLEEDRTDKDYYANIAEELGDLVVYADLLAQSIGCDLSECVINSFNKVSERKNYPIKL